MAGADLERQRREALRALPSVDRLAVSIARAVLAERRAELLDDRTLDDRTLDDRTLAGADLRDRTLTEADLVRRGVDCLRPSLRRVLNATGVILHTNLGRAPLALEAAAAVARTAYGYSNLELDLDAGERGSRQAHVERMLCELTGAEAALAVNNGAAAALLAAAAVAGGGGELVVSRGQLIEIGGGFRIPDVIVQAGARLVEVGTTNRTRLADYRAALGPDTAGVVRVHTSNFRAIGFTEQVEIEGLCSLGVPVIDDLGSGVLAHGLPELADEPPVRRSVAAGATLVSFSGDKLLGGPQAGLLVGRRDAIDAARVHPLARAVRIDKLSLAGLAATLALYRDPDNAQIAIPALAMLSTEAEVLERRAREIAAAVGGEIVEEVARVGGGALPLLELRGPAVAIDPGPAGAGAVARSLRLGSPPLVVRVNRDRLIVNPRTLADDEVGPAVAALRAILP